MHQSAMIGVKGRIRAPVGFGLDRQIGMDGPIGQRHLQVATTGDLLFLSTVELDGS